MSRFVELKTARVDLGEGDWIDVRTQLSFGDRLAIQEVLIGEQESLDKVEALHHRDADLEVARRSIVAWGGPGFCELAEHPHDGDCRPRPMTAENIEQLDGRTGTRLMVEIQKRQVTHSADLKGTPTGSTSPESRGGSGGVSSASLPGSIISSSARSTAGPGASS